MNRKRLFATAACLVPMALYAQISALDPAARALIADIPTTSTETAAPLFKELAKQSANVVPNLAAELTTQKSDADTTARFALGGLVWTVGHDGSDQQKQELASLLVDAIADVDGVEPKTFLIEQLQYMNQDSVAEALYPLVTDKDLGTRAIRTLAALNPTDLAPQFIAKLDDSNTTEIQTGLLLTLADLAPAEALDKATELAGSDNPYISDAALDVLAAIGDPGSKDLLQAAAKDDSETFHNSTAPARYLDYALVLAKNGHTDAAVGVCQEMIAVERTTATTHLVGLALTVLTDIQGEKALDELVQHVRDDEEDIRAAALNNLNRFEDASTTKRILDELKNSPHQEVTVAILQALGNRKSADTLDAITALFSSDDPVVAAHAVRAAAQVDREAAMPAMIAALSKDANKDVLDTIVSELRRVESGKLLPAAAEAIAGADPAGQVALIGLLGERYATSQKAVVFENAKSDNARVRSAAYDALGKVAEASDLARLRDMLVAADSNAERNSARQAFVSVARETDNAAERSKLLTDAMESASDDAKAALLQTMAALADKQSLPVVTELARSGEGEVQNAAVRALSDWQSLDARDILTELASSKNETHQVLAVRGLTRLTDSINDRKEKTSALAEALRLAKRDDERKAIITKLGDIKTTRAMKVIAPHAHKEGMSAEVSAALIKIIMPDRQGKNGIRGAEALELLNRALDGIQKNDDRKPVEKYIYELINEIQAKPVKTDDEGFMVLFNGENLDGWVGDTEGYIVEDGVLVCTKERGGKLFTEKQFGDFIMQFEFKLQAGGNNGVGIRTPLFGDPAYAGMEIQILDDKDPQYANIKDWQVHGSVYGIAGAQPGDNLKVGEWNKQEISVVGRNIKVTLNGVVINDVNLDEAVKDGIASGKPHPGMDNNRGHIGFLGHDHRVEFRNIRVKNVANEAPEGFTALFNGENLDGWKGLVENPIKRAAMSESELKEKQKAADKKMHDHWSVHNGILFFDGEGSHMCTIKDYRNFEMLVDWAIPPGGDNGLYLRGTPQVQIWDPHYWPQGSGGLYNNVKGTSDPLTLADNPIGQWNTFRIKMVDDKVTVHLNDELVVDEVVLENYWDRKQPIFPREQIELQSHGSPAWWRNIYIRELPD